MASQYKLKKGESVFEVDLSTGTIVPAKYKQLWKGRSKAGQVLIERKGHIYLPALNKNHATFKYDQIVQSTKDVSDSPDGRLHCMKCNEVLPDADEIVPYCESCTSKIKSFFHSDNKK